MKWGVARGIGLARAVGFGVAGWADEAYRAEVQKWRDGREARLKADGGWLTVAGLFWLKEGANRFGTDPAAEIALPAGSAPARAGGRPARRPRPRPRGRLRISRRADDSAVGAGGGRSDRRTAGHGSDPPPDRRSGVSRRARAGLAQHARHPARRTRRHPAQGQERRGPPGLLGLALVRGR